MEGRGRETGACIGAAWQLGHTGPTAAAVRSHTSWCSHPMAACFGASGRQRRLRGRIRAGPLAHDHVRRQGGGRLQPRGLASGAAPAHPLAFTTPVHVHWRTTMTSAAPTTTASLHRQPERSRHLHRHLVPRAHVLGMVEAVGMAAGDGARRRRAPRRLPSAPLAGFTRPARAQVHTGLKLLDGNAGTWCWWTVLKGSPRRSCQSRPG